VTMCDAAAPHEHTHTHTHTHAQTHTHTHTHTHIYTHTYTHTHIHAYTHTAKTLVLNMQHQAGVKLAVLIFGVGLTPLGVNTKSKTARFGTFL